MIINGKTFAKFIPHGEITERIRNISNKVNEDYKGKTPLFIAILNGSFMFAADLFKEISLNCVISFVKFASYEEMESTGNVKQLIGLNENIFKRDVIIVEDIIDTGRTINKIQEEFKSLGVRSIEIISLLQKPTSKRNGIRVKYVGFDIPDKFVIGYGMDYSGFGRNSPDIFQLKE